MHAPGCEDPRGLQPAKQWRPVPQIPHSEQQGEEAGHRLFQPQDPTIALEEAPEDVEVDVEVVKVVEGDVVEVVVVAARAPMPQGIASPLGCKEFGGGI